MEKLYYKEHCYENGSILKNILKAPFQRLINRDVRITHQIYVLHYVLERRMSSKLLKEVSLIKQGIHHVRVVMQRIRQAGVDDLQHHSNDFLNHIQILGL